MESISDMRRVFMESAVHVAARDGLEKTTTKAIAKEAGRNEAYIYKCYSGKDELLKDAFLQEDINFVELLDTALDIMHLPGFTWKERAFLLFRRSWDFILEYADDFIFYIRYYYSAACRDYAYADHEACYRPVIDRVRDAFRENVNVKLLIHQVFITMLVFGTKVIYGELEHSEDTARMVFEQIYNFVVPHVREERLTAEEKTLE